MEHTLKKGDITVTAADHGAELRRLVWHKQDLMWDAKPDIWGKTAPVCFPWVGKLADGEGSYRDQHARGPQHGFARDLDHVLVGQGEDFLRFRLSWPGGDNWPWPFSLETEHRVTGEGVVTTCTVTNAGSGPMAMQLGFHPAFVCPFLPGTGIEEYQARFESGLVVPMTRELFDNDSIRYDGVGEWARLEHRESGKYIQVKTAGFYCVLLWSKPGIPGFVCIEPWQGYPGPQNALDQRPGAVVLSAGERRAWVMEVKVGL